MDSASFLLFGKGNYIFFTEIEHGKKAFLWACVSKLLTGFVCNVSALVLAAFIESPVPLLHYASLGPCYWESPKFLSCAPSKFLPLCQGNKRRQFSVWLLTQPSVILMQFLLLCLIKPSCGELHRCKHYFVFLLFNPLQNNQFWCFKLEGAEWTHRIMDWWSPPKTAHKGCFLSIIVWCFRLNNCQAKL